MVKDRLEEFQRRAKLTGTSNDGNLEKKLFRNMSFPSESAEFLNEEHWEDVEEFLDHVKNLQEKMGEMDELLKNMRDIHDTILKSPFVDPTLSKNLNSTVESFKSYSHTVNTVLKRLNMEVNRQGESNEANYRIKKNHMASSNRKFQNLMIEFNNEQVRYREKSQHRIRSYLHISGVEMPDDAIEEAIENGRIFDTVSIFMAERDKKAIFDDVKSRHEDILKLEASIRDLHEIFQDMSMLVESQGEMVYNIERNVETAQGNVSQAAKNVKYAYLSRNRNIKMKIAAIIGIIIILLILFFAGSAIVCFYFSSLCH